MTVDIEDKSSQRMLNISIATAMFSSLFVGVAICMLVRDVKRADWTGVILWGALTVLSAMNAFRGMLELRQLRH
jgi:hypothetical protein